MAFSDPFERILAALHRAMLDDAHWPIAAALIEDACGAISTSLSVGEGRLGDPARIHFTGVYRRGERRPDLERAYFDIYDAQEERVPSLRRLPAGQLTHVRDLYTPNELKTSAIYNEALPRVGGQSGLAARLDGPDGLHIVWGVGDPILAGGWQADRVALMEHLLPHIRHFVLVRQALAAAESLGAGLAGVLEGNRVGVLHLDGGGGVAAANERAADILRRGDGLSDQDGTLRAWLPADNERLRRRLGRALSAPGGETPRGGSMAVRRPQGGARLALHVSPVGEERADFGGRRVAAWVLVVDPAQRQRVDARWVGEVLGLTPAQGRVAAQLAEGRSVGDIAAAAGQREQSVRRLLWEAYRKHGVSRQGALARLVLAADALRGARPAAVDVRSRSFPGVQAGGKGFEDSGGEEAS